MGRVQGLRHGHKKRENRHFCMGTGMSTDMSNINIFVFTNLRWLCGTESPCANVDPKFMDNAQFYFNVEFSNR